MKDNKFWKWTKDEDTGERILRLDGVIHDWGLFEDWFKDENDETISTPKEFRDELNSATGDILIYIYSPGGNIFSAAEIYSMLKEYSGGKITVRIAAYAASAATIIAMAANTVEISPLAVFCIHNPYLDYVSGDERVMLSAAKYLADLKENVISAYELKTKLPREQISDLMDSETYMNAQKAVELHFADKIIFYDDLDYEVGEPTAQMYSSRQAVTSMQKKIFGGKNLNRSVSKNMINKNFYKQFADLK